MWNFQDCVLTSCLSFVILCTFQGQPGKSSHFIGAHIMPTKQYPTDVLVQAKVVLDSWNQLGDLSFGNLNAAALNKDLDQAKQIDAQMVNLENQLTNLRNQRIS